MSVFLYDASREFLIQWSRSGAICLSFEIMNMRFVVDVAQGVSVRCLCCPRYSLVGSSPSTWRGENRQPRRVAEQPCRGGDFAIWRDGAEGDWFRDGAKLLTMIRKLLSTHVCVRLDVPGGCTTDVYWECRVCFSSCTHPWRCFRTRRMMSRSPPSPEQLDLSGAGVGSLSRSQGSAAESDQVRLQIPSGLPRPFYHAHRLCRLNMPDGSGLPRRRCSSLAWCTTRQVLLSGRNVVQARQFHTMRRAP
jgi:hypothetical protein